MKYFEKEKERRDLASQLEELTQLQASSLPNVPCLPGLNLNPQESSSHSGTATGASKSKIVEEGPEPVGSVEPSPPDLSGVLLRKLGSVQESRSRLKEKTRSLLRQYRDKRALLERRERQLIGQRAGLQQLQLLVRGQNSCQLQLLRHTAYHLQELAHILVAFLPETERPPELVEERHF